MHKNKRGCSQPEKIEIIIPACSFGKPHLGLLPAITLLTPRRKKAILRLPGGGSGVLVKAAPPPGRTCMGNYPTAVLTCQHLIFGQSFLMDSFFSSIFRALWTFGVKSILFDFSFPSHGNPALHLTFRTLNWTWSSVLCYAHS